MESPLLKSLTPRICTAFKSVSYRIEMTQSAQVRLQMNHFPFGMLTLWSSCWLCSKLSHSWFASAPVHIQSKQESQSSRCIASGLHSPGAMDTTFNSRLGNLTIAEESTPLTANDLHDVCLKAKVSFIEQHGIWGVRMTNFTPQFGE
jgi:hypothetical protein